MPEVLTHGSAFSVTLDKGDFVSPVNSTLEVSSAGFKVLEQEAAVQSDIDATLAKLIAGLVYKRETFLDGKVTFNKISKITLSESSKKGNQPVVLKGEIECTIIVVPAKANNTPDVNLNLPVKAIVTFTSVQSQYQSK